MGLALPLGDLFSRTKPEVRFLQHSLPMLQLYSSLHRQLAFTPDGQAGLYLTMNTQRVEWSGGWICDVGVIAYQVFCSLFRYSLVCKVPQCIAMPCFPCWLSFIMAQPQQQQNALLWDCHGQTLNTEVVRKSTNPRPYSKHSNCQQQGGVLRRQARQQKELVLFVAINVLRVASSCF